MTSGRVLRERTERFSLLVRTIDRWVLADTLREAILTDAIPHEPPTKSPERPHFDLDAYEEVFSGFLGVLKTSPHPPDLENWVKGSELRQNLLADVAVGRIRWPKSLGRPDAPHLSAGFVIDAQFWVNIWHIGLGGETVTDYEGWLRGDEPSVGDGPAESDHYTVKYMFNAAGENDNLIEVRFSDVHWRRPARSGHRPFRRYLNPPGWQFYSAGRFTALPDITIGTQRILQP